MLVLQHAAKSQPLLMQREALVVGLSSQLAHYRGSQMILYAGLSPDPPCPPALADGQ